MAIEQTLSERKDAILRALVQHYITTGEPVGSEAIAATSGLGVSSATIRNELAALEEMGYLTHPHTSAGRMPTDRGYRYFVDKLPTQTRLGDTERKAIVRFFDDALSDVDQILRGTTQLLSRLTRYASLALAPSPKTSRVAHAELIQLGTSTLLLIVFDTGHVEKRIVEVPRDVTDDDLEAASRWMGEHLRGRSVAEAGEQLTVRSRPLKPSLRQLFERASEAVSSIADALAADHVVLGGVANIAAEQAFARRETLKHIFEELERESEILRLLRSAASSPPVSVTIGRESAVTGIWEASVVAAPYEAGGHTLGTIGVVGPTRMDYVAAITAVRAVAERLSAAVEALGGS